MERLRVPAAREGSFEDALFEAGVGDSLLVFDGSENGGVAGDESAGGLAAAPVAQAVMKAYLQTLPGVS